MTGNHETVVVVGFFSPEVIQHNVANGFSMALQLCATAQTHLCLSEALTFVQRNTRDHNFPGREMSTCLLCTFKRKSYDWEFPSRDPHLSQLLANSVKSKVK